jgi:hypothetical protein
MQLRTLTALALTTASLTIVSLTAAPAALAQTTPTPSSRATATVNVCLPGASCTSINLTGGNSVDIVRRTGAVVRWSLNEGSEGGQVHPRVLRRHLHGARRGR